MSRRYKGAILSANATSSSLPVSGLWTVDQQYSAKGAGLWPLPPAIPTIGTATAGNNLCALVSFTAGCTGYPVPVTYTVTSTPGNVVARGSASPIRIFGLTNGTSYTFKVNASNRSGLSSGCSAASNSVTAAAVGQTAYTTAGCYSFVVPTGVTSISVVTVAGGGGGGAPCFASGGGGGALAYANNISVTPGATASITVGGGGYGGSPWPSPAGETGGPGGLSRLIYGGSTRAQANGGTGGYYGNASGGGVATGSGGSGGYGGFSYGYGGAGGGGAGGYSGTGGTGGGFNNCPPPTGGSGGAGGGGGGGGYSYCYITCCVFLEYWGGGGGGGGVSILGSGGACANYGGGGGGGGSDGSFYINPSRRPEKGGGGGGGGGAVRVIWPGNTRSFPSTNTGNL